jgi:hypothetical protein
MGALRNRLQDNPIAAPKLFLLQVSVHVPVLQLCRALQMRYQTSEQAAAVGAAQVACEGENTL